jgi:hypothetical protein
MFQANNAYTRDQWFHSIIWKVRTCRSYPTIYYSCSTAAAMYKNDIRDLDFDGDGMGIFPTLRLFSEFHLFDF